MKEEEQEEDEMEEKEGDEGGEMEGWEELTVEKQVKYKSKLGRRKKKD